MTEHKSISQKSHQGTGSYPFPPQGLQLTIRFKESQPPLKRPCFFKASKVYWEHVGEYRQVAGVYGDMAS
jgi:hypothetical protein